MSAHREKVKPAVFLLIHVFKISACSNIMPYTKKQEAAGKKPTGEVFKYTYESDTHLSRLEQALRSLEYSQSWTQTKCWKTIYDAFLLVYDNYSGTPKALQTRFLRYKAKKQEVKPPQMDFFPELGEAVLSAPSICPYEAVPLPPAPSVSDTDLEYESDGQDAWRNPDALAESLDEFKVLPRMLRASDMDSMDVIDDEEAHYQEDEPEDDHAQERARVIIRLNSAVSPPPNEDVLKFLLTF